MILMVYLNRERPVSVVGVEEPTDVTTNAVGSAALGETPESYALQDALRAAAAEIGCRNDVADGVRSNQHRPTAKRRFPSGPSVASPHHATKWSGRTRIIGAS